MMKRKFTGHARPIYVQHTPPKTPLWWWLWAAVLTTPWIVVVIVGAHFIRKWW